MKNCRLAVINFILIAGALLILLAGFYAWADKEMGLEIISVSNGTNGTLIIGCADHEERLIEVKPGGVIKALPYHCGVER
jgi:hypothetical protein